MKFQRVIDAIERLAPPRYAESWDNVGLLVGSGASSVTGPVVLTIDLTERVLAEAVAMRASGVIAYHPPIWDPLKRVTDQTTKERIVMRALAGGLAVYSPHTALDAAPGGLTDWLGEGVSGAEGRIAGDSRALTPHVPPASEVKLVTFVPDGAVEAVRNALATAGAGRIGNYSLCSFTVLGTGTFLGSESTRPVVGEAGRLERAAEVRLEMVCPREAVAIALATLREFHPYEEPAIDVVELVPKPERGAGSGRRLVLDEPVTIAQVAARLKAFLGIEHVEVAPATEQGLSQRVTHVGICAGSGGEVAAVAHRNGCELFVTGELDHHRTLAAVSRGMSVLLAGHTNTERGYLPRLARRLGELEPGARFVVSTKDASPSVVA